MDDPWLVSDAHLATLDAAGLAQAQTVLAERWSSRWRPDALLMRYAASRGHDVSVPFGGDMAEALARVSEPALVMPSTMDRLIPPTQTRELVELLPRATVASIESPLGHAAAAPRAGTIEHPPHRGPSTWRPSLG